MDRLISLQAAIDVIDNYMNKSTELHYLPTSDGIKRLLSVLPSAQPDAIPLEWIAKHLEWLDNCDNDFVQLAKVGIMAMVEIWKNEKTQ